MRHNNGDSNSHRLSKEMLRKVSQSVEIPIYFLDLQCDIAYADQLERFITKFQTMGVDNCVFGDVSLKWSKDFSEKLCHRIGINPIFPLWQLNEEAYVKEFLNAQFKAVVKSVLPQLPSSMLGQRFDLNLIEALRECGAGVCGENGEYHTFVFDGPIFKQPVSYRFGNIISVPPYHSIELLDDPS